LLLLLLLLLLQLLLQRAAQICLAAGLLVVLVLLLLLLLTMPSLAPVPQRRGCMHVCVRAVSRSLHSTLGIMCLSPTPTVRV